MVQIQRRGIKKRTAEGGEKTRGTKKKNAIKNTTYIGTYNVRTLRTTEKEWELDNALREIKFDIIGLGEIRKLGENIVEKRNGNLLYYIGKTKGQKGVGFLVHKHLKHQIQEFIGVSDRIAALKLEIDKTKTIIIQIYAPTEGSTDEEIENFYGDLEETMVKYTAQRVFVMGDFNGQIGTTKEGETTVGPYGIGSRSRRGERLIQFAQEHNLFILNTFYKKPATAKWTWKSPDGKTRNEIDFILSNSKENIRDVQVLNGVKFDTDHRMVRAALETNRKSRKRIQHKKQGPTAINRETYKAALNTRIQQMQSTTNPIGVQEQYSELKANILRATRDAAQQDSKIRNREKLSENTIRLINERERLKGTSPKSNRQKEEYSEINKLTKREIRKDLRRYEKETTKTILEESKSTKKIRKELNKGKQWMLEAKDKAGKTKRERKDIVKEATHFYKELYNSKETIEEKYLLRSEGEEDIPPILKDEISNIIKHLRRNKTPGEDGITNEYLQWGGDRLIEQLTHLFNNIIETETIPQQWYKSTIILIHKKGNREDLNNYRPISLISNLYKVFTKIMTNRLTKVMDENQPPEQAGFRTQYSTIDHLHTINQVIEKALEYNQNLYIALIDYSKAFDTVEHNKVLESLRTIGINQKYIRLLGIIYTNSKATVKTEIEGETFEIKRGVKQGDPISPKLFTCVLEQVFRKTGWNRKGYGISINGRRLTNLRFADDIALFAKSHNELQKMLMELNTESKKVGLEMNPSKTKIMTNHNETPISIEGKDIEYCSDYIYLGQTINMVRTGEAELKRRMRLAWGKFWSLKFILLDDSINIKLRFEVLQMCVIPVLIYGCQTWTYRKDQVAKLEICQRKMERKMLGLSLRDRIRNEELRIKSGLANTAKEARKTKWRWGGHVIRMEQERWTYTTTVWDQRRGKRRRGRPRRRWADEFIEEVGTSWTRQATDREKWRKVIDHIN